MSDADKQLVDAPDGGMDWFVQNIVKLAENDIGVSVILTTTGGTVSGSVISGKRYLEKLANSVASSGETEAFSSLAEWFAGFEKSMDQYDQQGPYFIHLENARLTAGSNLTPPAGLWRGNLAHVVGITLGSLN